MNFVLYFDNLMFITHTKISNIECLCYLTQINSVRTRKRSEQNSKPLTKVRF
jgi:hypothetical protein